MYKLLIVVYGGGHVNIIVELYKELSKKFDVTIIALTSAKFVLNKMKIPHKDLRYYYEELENTKDILGIGNRFITKHLIDYSKLGYEDSILYYGFNVRDYIFAYGENDLDDLYDKYGRSIFLPLHTMNMIIDFEKPDAVLTTNSPRFERAALLVSREKNIPNFSIEDLFGQSRLHSVKEMGLLRNYYGDYIFVMNDMVKDSILKKGIQAKEIISSGQPAFQGILEEKENPSSNDDILTEIGLSIFNDKKIVLYASQQTEHRKLIFEDLVSCFSQSSNKILVIKPHPNEDVEFMKDAISLLPYKNILIITNTEIRKLIKIADVVITQFSTCGLEAILMDKPVIVLKPNFTTYELDYAELGLAFELEDIKKIETLVDLIINNQNDEFKKVYENILKFKMSVNSSEIISNYIYEKIKERFDE